MPADSGAQATQVMCLKPLNGTQQAISYRHCLRSTGKLLVATRDLQAALTDSPKQHARFQSEREHCKKHFLHGYDVAQSLPTQLPGMQLCKVRMFGLSYT